MSGTHVFQRAHTEALYNDLRRANTESAKKERFLQYLTTTFAGDGRAQKLIAAIALGAERTVANIPRGVASKRGRADTQTDTVIVEWERDLAKTGPHAIEQLAEYLVGNWNSGQDYRYVLIATDGIRWRTYAPDWSYLAVGGFSFGPDFKLREVRKFDLSPDTFDEFPFLLDEVFFSSRPKLATLENVQGDFGDTSAAFINSMRCLNECAKDIERRSDLQVAIDQWRRFLSVAYGRFDDSPEMFLVHTYLSVFAKFIAYAVITRKDIPDDDAVRAILDGSVFEKLNVERFVEDDFFHWVASRTYLTKLRLMFRALNLQIREYDFTEVREDILKGVYQELIDLDTRHALGEYYTPDWLCEKTVSELPITEESKVLDPACGSGSFLRAVLARMRKEFRGVKADAIASQVVGIDIHPLSVQIAKTTVLLALGGLIREARAPVTLHIYLANSLLVPRETADMFRSVFTIAVDNKQYSLDISGLTGPDDFDKLITFCDELASRNTEVLAKPRFLKLTERALPKHRSPTLADELYGVYCGMKRARDEGRDSIWKFILQNTYKPVFLRNRFDVVVGNPPWLTYSDVANADYQGMLRSLADGYGITPGGRNMPHLEIAAIFLAHSINYFLKPNGRVALVLPRSFMTADQHENTRSGSVEGVKLTELWDLKDVEPLFRVPCCVTFAKHAGKEQNRGIPRSGIPGYVFAGRLPKSHLHWEECAGRISQTATRWHYSKLQSGKAKTRSAITQTASDGMPGRNPYAELFKQGSSIVPRSFYFIDFDQDVPREDLRGRVISAKTSADILRDAKAPWKDITLAGRIEGDYLFSTVIAKNILPFAIVNPLTVVLPISIDEKDGKRCFVLLGHEKLLERGARHTSKWFWNAEQAWERKKTEKATRAKMTFLDRINFQRGITDQNPDSRYLVLFCRSAQDGNAVTVDARTFNMPFVADFATYWFATSSMEEAHYLTANLNSGYTNRVLKEFQTRGLFGARDVTKKIVEIPFPRFDKKNDEHLALARLGAQCASLVGKFVSDDKTLDLDARSLGRLRSRVRDNLAVELSEIDVLVEKLSTGKSETAIRASKKGGRKTRTLTGRLFE